MGALMRRRILEIGRYRIWDMKAPNTGNLEAGRQRPFRSYLISAHRLWKVLATVPTIGIGEAGPVRGSGIRGSRAANF